MTAGEWHPAAEEYCECIFELDEEGVPVIQARIVDRLGLSRPTVSETVHRLEGEGLLTIEGGGITLTEAGHALASRVVRRHRLAERFLADRLGLTGDAVHQEAGKWEHVINDAVEAALARVLDHPTTCPHGNPIPPAVPLDGIHPEPLAIINPPQ